MKLPERTKEYLIAVFLVTAWFVGSIGLIDNFENTSPLFKVLIVTFYYLFILVLGFYFAGGRRIIIRFREKIKKDKNPG